MHANERQYNQQRPLWPFIPVRTVFVPLCRGMGAVALAASVNCNSGNAKAHRQVCVGAAGNGARIPANGRSRVRRTTGLSIGNGVCAQSAIGANQVTNSAGMWRVNRMCIFYEC